MEAYRSVAGATESPEISISKGIAALIISTTKLPSEMTTELISVWVEKEGGNKHIAKDVLLKDFILLGTVGEDCILSDATYKSISHIDLTEMDDFGSGYIPLIDGESIKIKIKGMTGTATYVVNGIESHTPSNEILMYERKSMGSEDIDKNFNTIGYDFGCLQKDASISEIAFKFDNGTVCQYSPFELDILAKTGDQNQFVNQAGVLFTGQTDRMVFPLKGVINVNIRKSPGTRLDFTFRIDESDFEFYQMKNPRN